jgi:tryptophan synthase alpha chain
MSRIARAFARAASENRAALIGYVCAGDPSLEVTEAVVLAMSEHCDVIELGVPFSDPTADGPVIQRASERALAGGASMGGVLDLAQRIRAQRPELALLLFGYANPILSMGEAVFLDRASTSGIDGLLAVDLPFDEAVELREGARARGIDWVPLVAPTTTDARAEQIGGAASGFVYLVSVAGVTGAGAVDFEGAASRATHVRNLTGKPVAVGFGVRTEADAQALARGGVDGVVVGSALVSAIASSASSEQAVARVSELLTSLARGVRR